MDRPPPLPRDHPLAGCHEKLWRAHEHFELLDAEIGKIQSGEIDLADFRTEPKPDTENTLRTVVDSVTEPDLRLATILGDAIHNLRSSLDHLVFELAFLGLRGRTIPDKTAFPVSLTRANWRSSHVQDTLLGGVLKEHRALLYQAQPCYRKRATATARAIRRRKRHPIADLQDLWNEDKHRMVHPVVLTPHECEPVIGPFHDCRLAGEPTINFEFVGRPVEVNTEVVAFPVVVTGPDPRVHVQIKVAGQISLRNGFPVLEAMTNIGNYVQAIVARFDPVFETRQARALWGLPRGGFAEREQAKWGRVTRRGWTLTHRPTTP